jgi:hypothetical protein
VKTTILGLPLSTLLILAAIGFVAYMIASRKNQDGTSPLDAAIRWLATLIQREKRVRIERKEINATAANIQKMVDAELPPEPPVK